MSFRLLPPAAFCVGDNAVGVVLVVVDGDAAVGLDNASVDVDVGNASFGSSRMPSPSSGLPAVMKAGSSEDAASAVDPVTTACCSSCASSASSSTCSVPISMLSSLGLFPSTNQRLQRYNCVS